MAAPFTSLVIAVCVPPAGRIPVSYDGCMWAPLVKFMHLWRRKPHGANSGDGLTFHDSLRYKLKGSGVGTPVLEGSAGDDLHRKTGRWMRKVQIVDRANNRY